METLWWVGHGIVVKGVQSKDNPIIEVHCPELLPLEHGMLDSEKPKESFTLSDQNGKPINSSITLTSVLVCKYMGDPRNMSIPDVVPGERVRVYNYRGRDEYLWIPYLDDSYLRETEHTRVHAVNRKMSQTPLKEDDLFFIEIDTRYQKCIRLKTNKGRGEKFAYLVDINAADGTITLTDDDGNFIKLTSEKTRIEMVNKKGTTSIIEGVNITHRASGLITLDGETIVTKNLTVAANTNVGANLSVGGASSFAGHASFAGGTSGDRT